MSIFREFNISMIPGKPPLIIHVSQYESDFVYTFHLVSGKNVLAIPDTAIAVIRGTKRDGNGFSKEASLDTENNKVVVIGEAQMTACAGKNVFELAILNNEKTICTANFYLDVERAPLDSDTIQSETVLHDLQAIINSAATATQAAEEASASAAEAAESARTLTIDPTLTQSGQPADAYETGVRFGENENSLSVVNELLDVETAESINRIDPDATTVGRYLYNGTFQTDSDYKTTDYIPVNTGDVLAFYKRIDAPSSAQRHTGERLALFDASKNYIGVSGQYPINVNTRYTVEDASARYIRLSYPASLGDVELVINLIVDQFTEYTPPHYTSKRLDNIERIAHQITPLKVIDCWGDSRTDMSDDGTSFCDYLGTLLGNTWIVSNRGISGQASGQVAARYGSNEIYLTLQNNKIAASGSTLITAYRVTTGTNTNLRGGDSTYGVHGILNGVSGKYIHTTGGNINFVRDYDGSEVKVKPNTKLIPDAYFNGSHCQILWCGKNDFPYAYPNVVAGIEGNYDGMVAKINHDKFLILGETYSIGSDYAEGTGNRNKVDTVNSDLLTKYPDNFIDIQAELIDKGLTLEGITPTSADTENISNGFIPDSLMFDSVHPNQYGREAIAKIIYAWMQNKGWV